MSPRKTVTLKGRVYDAVTGMPIDNPKTSSGVSATSTKKVVEQPKSSNAQIGSSRSQTVAGSVHSSLQRSVTLARRVAKKPIVSVNKIVRRPQVGRAMDIARAGAKKFAPMPKIKQPEESTKKDNPDKPAKIHPTASRALQRLKQRRLEKEKLVTPKTSKQIKDEAIANALKPDDKQLKRQAKGKNSKKQSKTFKIIGYTALGILILLGALYAVYRFVPAVSVGIAASQAGINAAYPNFVPDGYSLSQPITFSDGQVDLKFNSNSNASSYTISQKRSTWDSSAVLENVVQPLAGQNYTTTQERGLTIYTYNNGAAWVNGGILYTISGDVSLSNEQVRRIATSL